MIYQKLPVVFLSTIASEKKGSTNSEIATYLLDHLNEVQKIGISEMAKRCHVANSSISRFCKEIGLADFNELKELLLEQNIHFEKQSNHLSGQERIKEYSNTVKQSIDEVTDSINLNQIHALCKDIHNYDHIAAFGLLKAASAAICLQGDLLMQGKQIYTNISFQEQMDHIFNADENQLIIIFSYTGSYFDYKEIRALKHQLSRPKIWMITGNEIDYPDYIDNTIIFKSKHDQSSHPYQLQFIENIIAQEYANMYFE